MSKNESRLERGPSPLILLDTYLGAIDDTAEKMARGMIRSKGRKKVTVEEELKNNLQLREIKVITLLIRKNSGLISEDEFTNALDKLRKTQQPSE
jgi:hypothetical protein